MHHSNGLYLAETTTCLCAAATNLGEFPGFWWAPIDSPYEPWDPQRSRFLEYLIPMSARRLSVGQLVQCVAVTSRVVVLALEPRPDYVLSFRAWPRPHMNASGS